MEYVPHNTVIILDKIHVGSNYYLLLHIHIYHFSLIKLYKRIL